MGKYFIGCICFFLIVSCSTIPNEVVKSKFGSVQKMPLPENGIIRLEAGVYETPLDFSQKGKYEIIGAGTGKTLITLPKNMLYKVVVSDSHVIFRDLTFNDVEFTLKTESRADFIRVDFAGRLGFSGSPGEGTPNTMWPKLLNVRMVNVTIPNDLVVKIKWVHTEFYSQTEYAGIMYTLSRSTSYMPSMNFGLDGYRSPWKDQNKVESFDTPESQELMTTSYLAFRNRDIKHGRVGESLDDLFAWANEARLIGQESFLKKNEVLVTELLKKADHHKLNKNFLLEFYSLYKADVANQLRVNPEIKKRQTQNFKMLSELYGCQASYGKAPEGIIYLKGRFGEYDYSSAYGAFVESANKVIPFVTALGSSDSKCFLELLAVKDYFLGENSSKMVTAEVDNWVETQASISRRVALESAATEARFQAASNQFSSSLNRLSSTATQLQANRNRLEDKPDGLYLVMPNKGVKGASIAEIQQQARLNERSQQASMMAGNNNTEYEVKGKIQTVNYYKNWDNQIQFNIRLTKNKNQISYAFPLKKKSHFMACQDTRNTLSNFNNTANDTCNGIWFYEDSQIRSKYMTTYVEAPMNEFLLTQVLPEMIQEMEKKSKSSNKENQLDAILLANLIADKESPVLDQMSLEVLGEPIDYDNFKKTLLNFR